MEIQSIDNNKLIIYFKKLILIRMVLFNIHVY